MGTLALDSLPVLPQFACLPEALQRIWEQDDVIALWIGGSVARGIADAYSDLDLRLCVSAASAKRWKEPDLPLLFGEEVVGERNLFGPIYLHQIVLKSGLIVDFWVQTPADHPPADCVLLLGCRDEEFEQRLVSAEPEPAYAPKPAEADVVRQLITDFWSDSLKANKVLHRSLDGLLSIGIGLEHALIMRLWHILATGSDTGTQRPTIHSLTAIVRHIDVLLGPQAQELVGMPLRNRAELCTAVEANRDEVSRVGKILAERLGFAYPASLERTVRSSWSDFLANENRVS